MLDTTKRTLAILTASAFLGGAGWAVADRTTSAATSTGGGSQNTNIQNATGGTTTQTPGRMGRHGMRGGTAASADELAKITAAVTAKLAGAKVERAMKVADGTFHAMVTKSDGTRAHVALDANYAVTAVDMGGPGAGHRGGPRGPHGTPASADELAKITAAVKARIAGATVQMAMKESDGTFHAMATKADGTRVHVELDAKFAITSASTGGKRGGPGPGRARQDETPLTGDAAAKAKAAALAKVPGATVDKVEKDADGDVYEAHITKPDGTKATVKMDANFNVTKVEQG